jgi:hypothetical protein
VSVPVRMPAPARALRVMRVMRGARPLRRCSLGRVALSRDARCGAPIAVDSAYRHRRASLLLSRRWALCAGVAILTCTVPAAFTAGRIPDPCSSMT